MYPLWLFLQSKMLLSLKYSSLFSYMWIYVVMRTWKMSISPLLCSLTEWGTLFNMDASPEQVVSPTGVKARGKGSTLLCFDTLTHTCLMLASELGQHFK